MVVHGIWSSTSRLCLWGEDGDRPVRVTTRSQLHPFACAAEQLREAIGWSTQNGEGTDATLSLLLPTRGATPLASPEVAHGSKPGPGRTGLRAWWVPAIGFGPDAAIDLLLSLPLGAGPGVTTGATLGFLGEVCKLALELVARGRVLPVLEGDGERYAGRWRSIPNPEDGRRLRLLAQAMPPACRAEVVEPATGAGDGRAAGEVLGGLLDALVDAAARSALNGRGLVGPRRGRAPAQQRPAEAWLRSLAGPDPTVRAAPAELAVLERELQSWREPGMAAPGQLRVCFRVEPPDAPDAKAARWRVEFLLQAPDDPSLLVPADEVWRSGQRLALFDRMLEQPQERLLAELGRASRLWPDLEGALQVARPVDLTLDVEAAYRFLRDAAPLLTQAGFGVLVPPWWRSPATRIGLRLKTSAKRASEAAATPGRLGLESLVDYEWELALGQEETLSAAELRELARLKVPLVQVRGRWVELWPEEVEAALTAMDRQAAEDGGQMSAAEILRAGLGLEPSPDGLPVVGVEAGGWIGELLAGAVERRLEPVPTPAGFDGSLRPYQERGLAWLSFLGSLGLGACLADDMGLGKTVQLLALLVRERASGVGPKPTLLVCPMSVVGNWQREASRFAPSLGVYVHHGSERLAGDALAEAVGGSDLVVTTYALAARDHEALAALDWERIVLDEAQNIKNSAARQTQAIRKLRAPQRVALTGTPVENRLSELWSIMEYLNPGLLGSASDFRRRVAVPIERYHDESAAALLKRVTAPFVLRRLKTDRTIIADLPDKVEMKVFCNITKEQATLYQAVLDDMLAKIEEKEGIERKGLVLATMLKLKQALNHPAQLLRDGSRLDGRSGKLARVEEILEEVVAEGDRALLFTQFAEMGQLLEGHLRQRFGQEVLFLHGGTPKRARDEMVTRFQSPEGPALFILSVKAGGTGLNLTAANHVIHFDRWWNPAVEDQATDRAFRIGQRKAVQVRKLVCVGTLEERIDRMIEDKRELAQRIVGTGESWLTELSTSELREVVALSADAVAEG